MLCVQRRTGEVLWQYEAGRDELSLAVGGGKVFCGEVTDPKRGEDETSDGRTVALSLATGEVVWQRAGGARLRYSVPLDLVVTPSGFYRGGNGEAVASDSDAPHPRLMVKGNGLPEAGLPGYLAGDKLLTGSDDTLQIVEIPSGSPVGKPVNWFRRGCTGTRA